MNLPVIKGLIDRRILVNFRVEPEVLQTMLPPPFRPKLVRGSAMAGVCLIRLAQLRPRFVPAILGIGSENAAYRMAVEWDSAGSNEEGVFIPRRDTSSRLNVIAGGRIFPGEHHLADFDVQEEGDFLRVCLTSRDRQTRLLVEGRPTDRLPDGSVFRSVEEASAFFEAGSLGYSATSRNSVYDGLELRTLDWHVQPLEVTRVESTFFENTDLFPPESVEFDCALLMRKIDHEWHERTPLIHESPV